MSRKAAYVTLLTKASYLPGALVLHYCLVSVGSKYPLVIMVTTNLPQDVMDVLRRRGITTRTVDHLLPEEGTHNLHAHDERFMDTWTKLRAFELTEYERVVMLDSDMVVMRNMDELMEIALPKDWIAAVHVCACNPRKLPHYPSDWIPDNCAHTPMVHPTALTSPPLITETSPRPYNLLNSGTVVLNPSESLFVAIRHFLSTSPLVPTFSFPDQDLLAVFFSGKWKPLPWCYNALKTLRIVHKPLWRDEEVRCLHYILNDKPWTQPPGAGGDHEEVNQWWWDRYEKLEGEMQASDSAGWKLVSSNVAQR
ncbi:glycosyltransferase family 8 protein [Laetiporus sulphureus 93-53]|uniref:Glycosyltransferase family 8 protein n=1 Tax=Laetiporus sulphureus 93-53 TaxID=1314785 RepID=A0A165EDN7_9APHY|nr:glycosyltransferase family 8 protein [Laetiporus sulphureus 93-53]KZT06816.1 glycosyltransferase family 8 protein [Laetiporus sulphureus 93-53]